MYHPLRDGGGGYIPALYNLVIITPFGTVWLIYLLVVFLLVVLFWAVLKGKPQKIQKRAVLILGMFTILFLVAYRFSLFKTPDYSFEIWNELPLYPCNMMAFMGVAAVVSNRRLLQNFCSIAGTLSVISAFMAPLGNFSGVSLLSAQGFGYYGFHGLALLLCLSFPVLGLARPKVRDLPPVLLLSVLLTGAAHLLNLLLRATVYSEANYFYTFGIPDNPVLGPMRDAIPFDFLYLLPFMAVLVVWGLMMVAFCGLGEKIALKMKK